MAVVTISASYAAGGSQIAPRVAASLGVPFIDRAVPAAVAEQLGITVEEAEAVAQDAPRRLWGLLASVSVMPGYLSMAGASDHVTNERQLIESTELQIRRAADAGSCVILGRAAALVLGERPHTLHVRLDGACPARIESAMAQHGLSRSAAAKAQKTNDRIRLGYVQHFYHADSAHAKHYHLVLDSTRLGWDGCSELIVAAAKVVDQTG